MSDCIFCKIVAGELPCTKIYENEKVLAFVDIAPAYEIHYLFIPKKHHARLDDITSDELTIMTDIYQAINHVVQQQELSDKGFKCQINVGEGGGQVVFHMHIHLLCGKSLVNTSIGTV